VLVVPADEAEDVLLLDPTYDDEDATEDDPEAADLGGVSVTAESALTVVAGAGLATAGVPVPVEF
jgi:hypothetical protein